MAPTKVTTHAELAKGNLLEVFKGKSGWAGILDSYSAQVQDVENVLFELIEERFLDDAVGVQLDGIGQIVGAPREGLSDDDYRLRLRVQILINRSSGTIEDLLEIVALMIQDVTNTIVLTESFPAYIQIEVTEATTVDGFSVAALVKKAKAGGVRLVFVWNSTITPFAFDTTDQGFDKGEFAGAV